ncbi:hypothetical protein OV079_08485 [Nannocystis pusilla]|uniref:Uncharacterized protein n=1 Tax=Nannocystis pusilla TaxID=889268 RepID=A0A9X3ELZ4_9BACT|nr:hypothetical protein [Nannocystis pusilla]MCY1005604.1 hypothetical protein [Nannocystis pusilla]
MERKNRTCSNATASVTPAYWVRMLKVRSSLRWAGSGVASAVPAAPNMKRSLTMTAKSAPSISPGERPKPVSLKVGAM